MKTSLTLMFFIALILFLVLSCNKYEPNITVVKGTAVLHYRIRSTGTATTTCYLDKDNNIGNGVTGYSNSSTQTGPGNRTMSISNIDEGEYYAHCWFDTNSNGVIDAGDDFGTSTFDFIIINYAIIDVSSFNLNTL